MQNQARPAGAAPSGLKRLLRAAHFELVDHAIIRHLWWNLHEIAPGVWRSNHPGPTRLRRYQEMGINTVVSLRGETHKSWTLIEKEACARLGIELIFLSRYSARNLPTRAVLLEFIDALGKLPKPFVMHCKSGADRTGFAAALYLAAIQGRSAEEAFAQLHWRHAHSRRSRSGVLSHVFRVYIAERDRTGIGFDTWLRSGYDAEEITKSFQDWRHGKR
ncbi:tyrosine-protein phosphatase [Acidimangrovimonas pyrenivorans]|uniref:Tyrosine-protein phosphatase n=1 Tax=Acidimangrovimonas pyrenivorans TaxID=2030798 RepID=A0ABV7AH69_9RHOB